MGEHQIRQLDDGTHAVVSEDGRIPDITNPETNQRQVGGGFDSSGDAKKAAEASGLALKSAPSRSSGASKAGKKSGARRH